MLVEFAVAMFKKFGSEPLKVSRASLQAIMGAHAPYGANVIEAVRVGRGGPPTSLFLEGCGVAKDLPSILELLSRIISGHSVTFDVLQTIQSAVFIPGSPRDDGGLNPDRTVLSSLDGLNTSIRVSSRVLLLSSFEASANPRRTSPPPSSRTPRS